VAKIVGSERTVSSFLAVKIDGSNSYHPDYPGNAQPILKYRWSCKETPANSPSVECSFGSGVSDKVLTIPENSFSPLDVTYDFILNVSNDEGWNTASIRIHPTQESVPLITVNVQTQMKKYPPNKRMTLVSTVEPIDAAQPLEYQWTTSTGDVDLSRTQFLLSPNSRQRILVVKPNVLTAGQMYTVRLTVTENSKKGMDQVSFLMDRPPTGGVFEVSPTTGTSLDTTFKLSAVNWQADSDTLPITYGFEYLQGFDEIPNPQGSIRNRNDSKGNAAWP